MLFYGANALLPCVAKGAGLAIFQHPKMVSEDLFVFQGFYFLDFLWCFFIELAPSSDSLPSLHNSHHNCPMLPEKKIYIELKMCAFFQAWLEDQVWKIIFHQFKARPNR